MGGEGQDISDRRGAVPEAVRGGMGVGSERRSWRPFSRKTEEARGLEWGSGRCGEKQEVRTILACPASGMSPGTLGMAGSSGPRAPWVHRCRVLPLQSLPFPQAGGEDHRGWSSGGRTSSRAGGDLIYGRCLPDPQSILGLALVTGEWRQD